MQPINSSSKVWRIESTPNRKMASAMWRPARASGVPVRGWVDGQQCRVQMFATEWTVWKIVNHARQECKAAAAKSSQKASSSDAGYSDDTWAQDEPLTDDDGRYSDSDNLPYVLAVYVAARARGFEA